MILTVTLNTALDKTYQVGELTLGAAHRAEEAHAQAGGKGLNVARALASAGVAVLAAGLAAGSTGHQIERDLEVAGVDAAIHRVEGESRQTVTVVSRRGDAWLEIDEQGPELSPASWRSFLDSMDAVLHRASVVVLSGSLPPGTPVDAYRRLTELSHLHGAQVVLDAAGPAFEDALAAGPEVVTPNRSELASASGSRCGTLMEVVAACRKLEARGARVVVATLGADGAVATRGTEAWRARHPVLSGNPVGAGDALVAGIATSLVDGASLVDTLRLGCAWALASLHSPWAGHVDPDAVAAATPQVVVDPIANLVAAETEGGR
jgi:tagatose 6-phosphate kinase